MSLVGTSGNASLLPGGATSMADARQMPSRTCPECRWRWFCIRRARPHTKFPDSDQRREAAFCCCVSKWNDQLTSNCLHIPNFVHGDASNLDSLLRTSIFNEPHPAVEANSPLILGEYPQHDVFAPAIFMAASDSSHKDRPTPVPRNFGRRYIARTSKSVGKAPSSRHKPTAENPASSPLTSATSSHCVGFSIASRQVNVEVTGGPRARANAPRERRCRLSARQPTFVN